MNEQEQRYEFIGDGLLSAISRLYLSEKHPTIHKAKYPKLCSMLVSNYNIGTIAEREGLKPIQNANKSYARAFEIEITRRYYTEGFEGAKLWVYHVFDKYHDMDFEADRWMP